MRYFLKLSFQGAAYHGWQIQPSDVSVQETIEKAVVNRRQSMEYRRKFKEVNNLYSIQNRFREDD